METMSDVELVEFRNRCLDAAQHGHLIARADEYLECLVAEYGASPDDASAQSLFELADAVMASRKGDKKPSKKESKAKVVEPVQPPGSVLKPANEGSKTPVEPEGQPVDPVLVKDEGKPVEPAKEEVKVVSVPKVDYEAWTKEELETELTRRAIPHRAKMTKAEQIATLEESDAASAK